jgi:hypothetical protein
MRVRSVYVSNQNQSTSLSLSPPLSLSHSYWHKKYVLRCGFLLRVERFVNEYPFTTGHRGTSALKSACIGVAVAGRILVKFFVLKLCQENQNMIVKSDKNIGLLT